MIARAGKAGRALKGRSGPLLVVVLLALAAWFGGSAVQQWRQQAVGSQLQAARDAAVDGLQRSLSGQQARLARQLASGAVQQALAAGDAQAAALALRAAWSGAEDVQVFAADMEAAYADPKSFGYARLALLEAALASSRPLARVVRDGGGPRLGLAAAAPFGARDTAVVYLRLPLVQLTSALDAVTLPDGAYLSLRQDGYHVRERGVAELAGSADSLARPIDGTGFRLAAAAPAVDAGPLDLGPIPAAIVSLLLALIAVLVLVGRGRLPMPKRAGARAQDSEGPTLRETLSQGPVSATAPTAQAGTGPAGNDSGADTASPMPPPLLPGLADTVPAGIFRAYDVRGIVDNELTPALANLIGQAIGSEVLAQGLREIVVGRDGRLSGPGLSAALIEGLRRTGCDVIDIELAATPVVYFASHHLRTGSCVVVTGSHNPPEYNGFKVVVAGQTLSGDAIKALYTRIVDGRLERAAEPGGYRQCDVNAAYVQRIADDVQLERPLSVVADAGNGVGGVLAQTLLEAIGAQVIPLYCDVDGNFPNHHPDPSEADNLQDLAQMVKRFDADLGIAFDGDADRLGVVIPDGRSIPADRLLMLFAADVLVRNPGAMVIYDVKCTGRLAEFILRHGGSPLMWKTGHSLMKAKMAETDAELAGEMSGHFFFRERWFGFDDGLYAAARLLEILTLHAESPQEVLSALLPTGLATPEIKVPVHGHDPHALVAKVVSAAQAVDSPFASGRIVSIDGLRVDFADGWGLVRASNTTPVLVLRFEADDAQAMGRIQALFRAQLQPLLGTDEPGF